MTQSTDIENFQVSLKRDTHTHAIHPDLIEVGNSCMIKVKKIWRKKQNYYFCLK